MIAVRLGLRVIRVARWRSALFVLVGAVTSVALSVVLMAGQVKGREEERREQLVTAGERSPQVSQVHDSRGSPVTIVVIDARRRPAVVLPGMRTPLDQDEALFSPALAARVEDDPTLRSWFPYDVTGEIERTGIGSAGELKAYVGVTGTMTAGGLVVPDLGTGELAPFEQIQLAGFVLFVVIPALALVVTSSRFGRKQRSDRSRALRLLGMSDGRVRLALALEVAVPAAIGAVAAHGALFAATARQWFTIPVVDRAVFGADARLSWISIVLVVILAAAAAAIAGASVGSARGVAGVARTWRGRARFVVPASAMVFAIGLAVAGWAWIAAEPRDSRRVISIVLIGLGLPGAVSLAAGLVARALVFRREPLSLFLAVRRILSDPRTATRLAGMAAVIVFVIGVSQPVSAVFAVSDSGWVASARADGASSVVAFAEGNGVRTAFQVNEPPPSGVGNVVPVIALRAGRSSNEDESVTTAIIASCDQLRALVASLSDCTGDRQALHSRFEQPLAPGRIFSLRAENDESDEVRVEVPVSALSYGERQFPVSAGLLLPPTDGALEELDGAPEVIGAYFTVAAEYQAWEQAQAWVIRGAPLHRTQQLYDQFESTDETTRWVLLGTLVTSSLAAAAVVMISMDDRERRRTLAALRILGVGDRRLLKVQLVESTVGASVAMSLAALSAFVVASAFLAVNDESNARFGTLIFASAGGVLAVVAFGALSHLVASGRGGHRR